MAGMRMSQGDCTDERVFAASVDHTLIVRPNSSRYRLFPRLQRPNPLLLREHTLPYELRNSGRRSSVKEVKSRRAFLKTAACFFADAELSTASGSDAARVPGIQLYTVRDAFAGNERRTLAELRTIGYRQVEAAGFGRLTAKEFRTMLDELDFVCPSAHMDLSPAKLSQAFDEAHTIGASYVCSGGHLLVSRSNRRI